MQTSSEPVTRSKETILEAPLGRCLVEGDPDTMSRARLMRRKAFGISMTIELGVLVILVAAPLVSSVARPQLRNLAPPGLVFFGAWHAPSPVRAVGPPTGAHGSKIPDPFQRLSPPSAPARIQSNEGRADAPADAPDLGFSQTENSGPLLMGDALAKFPVEPPRAEKMGKPVQAEKRSLKMSERVLAAQLISRIEPRYPLLAVQTRKEGTVVLHAIISREGRITSLEVVSGPPLLVQAAVDAVRQWRYRPTVLDGEPVEVETTITVVFTLQS